MAEIGNVGWLNNGSGRLKEFVSAITFNSRRNVR